MSIARDLRYALRVLRRTPSFTIPAVLSIALGIAVNTTMFSVVNALLLRPLGGADGGELVRIGRSANNDGSFRSASAQELDYLRSNARSFAGIAGQQIESVTIGASEGAQVVSAEVVTADYFEVLRVPTLVGRTFAEGDTRVPGGSAVAVLSERCWRTRFAGAGDILGRHVLLNNVDFTIMGVAPPGFRGTFPGVDIDVWLPASMANAIAHRAPDAQPSGLMLIARLQAGVDVGHARAELELLARQMSERDRQRDPGRGFALAAARGIHPGFARVISPFLMLLMAVVGVVLLIACANVASLLLARAAARRAELAVRIASGAARARLIRQLLVESGVIATIGGGCGLLVSLWSVRMLNAFSLAAGPTGAPISFALQLDRRVLLFTVVVTVVTTLMFGLLPAMQATRLDVISALKGSESCLAGRRWLLRSGLLAMQITLSFVLLVAAVLLFRSAANTARIDLGFDPAGVVVTSFDLQMLGHGGDRIGSFYGELLQRARASGGVERAALAEFIPMGGRGMSAGVKVAGAAAGAAPVSVRLNAVSDGYFATIRHRLVRGREFTRADRTGPPVAIVNEEMARRFWPAGNALGQRIRLEDDEQDREIVGIAGAARYGSFGADVGPYVFLPLSRYPAMLKLLARSEAPPAHTLANIRRIAHELDPTVAAQRGETLREAAALALVPVRVGRLVFGVAGTIALLLASGGLYGLVCYTLQQRVKEIGIRIALGATRRDVFSTLVGGAVRITAIGVVFGAGLALAVTRLLTTLLYGVSPTDIATFTAIAALLIAISTIAGYAAARQGLNTDPMVVLRRE